MNYVSIGDMAQSFQLRQHNVQLKTVLNRLSEEVVTGQAQDVAEKLGGDVTILAGIDRSLNVIDAYEVVASEAGVLTSTMQASLGLIQDLSGELGPLLLSAATSASPILVQTSTNDAREKFGALVSALNTNVAGRYIFGGAETGAPPVMDSQQIIGILQPLVGAASTPQDAVQALVDWFDAPVGGGGFLDLAYSGSDQAIGPLRIAEGENLTVGANAADHRIRDAMKGFALAALVHDGLFDGDPAARTSLANSAGEFMLTAEGSLSALRAEIGTHEASISAAQARNQAQASSLQIVRTEMLAVDPYEAATALEAVQTQLETLYTLTARLSGLSLVDYI